MTTLRERVTDSLGRNIIASLFKEYSRTDVKFKWIYTLPQVKEMFLDARDPTEYKAAMSIVGDWDHWQQIRNHPYFKMHVDKWQQELAIKLKSEAIDQLQRHAKAVGGTAAAKWLADIGVDTLPSKRAGRPKKEEVEQDNSKVEEKLGTVLALIGGKK